jgi:septal ring factor EnvC (AmiA/AmiB activator)
MSSNIDGGRDRRIETIFAEFNESWMNYWSAYVDLQNQLYESVKAAREVSWLAATDIGKISEINQVQRELFAAMPRRMDYMPLGQVTRNLDSALSKLDELESALSLEKEKSKKLEEAIEELRERTRKTKEELRATMP